MNPYEPPQTIDTPPLPPAIQQTHLEQVSFRHLSEIAWGLALPRQIMIVALCIAILLVGVTWQFYLPGRNPNWVTIVMLGCGSVIAVLICWAGLMSSVAYSTLAKHVRHPPARSRREHVIMILCFYIGLCSITPIIMEFRSQLVGGTWLLLLPLSLLLWGLWLVTKQQVLLLIFLRSFVAQVMWRQTGAELLRLRLATVVFTMSCLIVMSYESVPGSIAWGWLMLALGGAIMYLVPFTYAYRQLAQEFDKLWP